jgi:L-threonylcarbamoyladenylate synthase
VGSLIIDSSNPEAWADGLPAALTELRSGQSIIMPTDTVYGIACDAFSPEAVAGLLAHKGRGRHMPPPVLVGSPDDAMKLARVVPPSAEAVMTEFWPGGVTVIVHASPDVEWDLGDTDGTVAIRMPDHPVALELLRASGPLAVSSANLTGQHSSVTIEEAYEQFGDALAIYIDAGAVGEGYRDAPGNPGSTIVDASGLDAGKPWRVVRHGVVPWEDIQAVAGGTWQP